MIAPTVTSTPVLALTEGDLVDLEHDPYANMSCSEGPDCTDCELTRDTFQYEYATVLGVELETAGCVRVDTDAASFGCPPDHTLPRVVES